MYAFFWACIRKNHRPCVDQMPIANDSCRKAALRATRRQVIDPTATRRAYIAVAWTPFGRTNAALWAQYCGLSPFHGPAAVAGNGSSRSGEEMKQITVAPCKPSDETSGDKRVFYEFRRLEFMNNATTP